MSKKRVEITSAGLLQDRDKFLTSGLEPLQPETPDQPEPATLPAEQTPAPAPSVPAPAPAPIAEPSKPEPQPKKLLLQQYLASKDNTADTMYLPPDLYDALVAVWYTRKRQQRGIKKSHLIIEALLQHAEIVEELRKRGSLK